LVHRKVKKKCPHYIKILKNIVKNCTYRSLTKNADLSCCSGEGIADTMVFVMAKVKFF